MLQFCFICLIKCFFYYDLSYQVFFLLLSVLSSVFYYYLSYQVFFYYYLSYQVFIIIITAPLKIEPYKNTVRFF